MTIRTYRPEDLPRLIALFRRSVVQGAARHYNNEQLLAWASGMEDAKTWSKRLSGQTVVVCEMEEQLTGFAAMQADGYLDLLFVDPLYHRQRIATHLYRTLETWAAQRGIRKMFTEASLTALPFFEKQGFEVIERQTVERRGISLDNFRMKKTLLLSS